MTQTRPMGFSSETFVGTIGKETLLFTVVVQLAGGEPGAVGSRPAAHSGGGVPPPHYEGWCMKWEPNSS